jgi:competence protein ComEA
LAAGRGAGRRARDPGSSALVSKGRGAALVAAVLLAPSAFAGPVNVNTADAKTLARELQGVGLAKAEAIVSYREKNGPFKSADDLAKVKGVGKKLLEQNKANLKFEASKTTG